jgi:diguanylate cyclase (GGDEF)-like protein/PAS domain S-box-containing protein
VTGTAPLAVALETAFDVCPLPMGLVALDGTMCRVNRAFAALLGYGVEELIGRRYQDLTPSEDAPLDEEGTRRLLDGEQPDGEVEKRLLRRDGRPVWVRVSVTPVWDAGGAPWGGVATAQPLHPPALGREPGSGDDGRRAHWLGPHDALTGAANQLLLHDRITLALTAAGVVAVLFCDVDRFKQINDTYGHGCGDQVLTAVVRRLQVTLRPEDTVARVGGDEFVVAACVETEADAHALHERVRVALARPLGVRDRPGMSVGVSVGLAVARGDTDVGRLLADADRAMYAEKARRRESRRAAVDGDGAATPRPTR